MIVKGHFLLPLLSLFFSLGVELTLFVHYLHAQEPKVTYFYDDLGRLKRVVDEQGEMRTYRYDAVGNICAIVAGSGGCPAGPPIVTSIVPASCLAGTTCQVTIEGESLLGAAVVSENTQAPMTHCRLASSPVSDCNSLPATEDCSRMTCRLTPSPFISPGPVDIAVTTPLGSVQTSIEILPPPTIGGNGQTNLWRFVASKGETITLTMNRLPNQPDGSSTLDPFLELQDSRGFRLISDDDSGSNTPPGPGRNATIRNFVLPATDTYTVVARGSNGSAGPYLLDLVPSTITLIPQPPIPIVPAFVFAGVISAIPAPAPADFTFQGTISAIPAPAAFTFQGTISTATEKDTFTFPANVGTVATIQVNRVANNPDGSSTLDPAVELRDSRGFLFAQDNDTGTNAPLGPGRNALILNFTLPATDTYSVAVKGSDGTTGPYQVKVIFGELTAETEPDTFMFPANAGTVATIQVNRVASNPDGSGTLDPVVELRDSRGFLIARDDDTGTDTPPGPGRNASIPHFTLPATDTYSITMKGSDGTVGPYKAEIFFHGQ